MSGLIKAIWPSIVDLVLNRVSRGFARKLRFPRSERDTACLSQPATSSRKRRTEADKKLEGRYCWLLAGGFP